MTAVIDVTWLGHSTFLFKTPEGKIILIDPWVQNNPICPPSHKKLKAVDLMLISHAHFDHIGDTVEIAKAYQPKIISIFETSEHSFLGDITEKQKRGTEIGKYGVFVGIAEALAIFIGGFLVGKFGFEIMFYIISIIFVVSTTVMFKLKE